MKTSSPRVEPRAYALPHVVRDFAGRDALYPAELAALAEVWPCVRGDVLDVGVGGGRTTRYLCGAARSYRAVDYQPEMVEACRRRFPGVTVDVGDARDLRGLDDASYDLFFFSFNGIDYISHHDRPRVFAEAFRLLRPGGAFVYSSHNLRPLGGALPGTVWPKLEPTLNPVVLAVRAARAGASAARILRNRRRFAHEQHLGDGWAAVNDEAYEHAMLTVYVDPAREPEQLAGAGFTSEVTFLGMDGRIAEPTLDDAWVHLVTRKPG